MGFNLYGINAKSEKGKYFQNSAWEWRPLAMYVLEYAGECLDDEEKIYWQSNAGKLVSEKQAIDIGNKLIELIDEGHTKAYGDEYLCDTHYPFSVENVQDFAEFCMNSGGFEIC